jgi:hypothetical protein
MLPPDGTALWNPWHSEEAATPTGTSRPVLAAIAKGRAVPAPPRGRGGASAAHCRLARQMHEVVRLLSLLPRLFGGGAGEARCL